MAATGSSPKVVYDRILRDLRENTALRARLQGRIYDSGKQEILPTEYPAAAVNIESITEEKVSEYPYLVRSIVTISIVVFLEVWDPARADFGGGREGRGLVDLAQDVKQALKDDLWLNSLCQGFNFSGTTVFDSPEFPARAVRVDCVVRMLEAQRSRTSAAI